MQYSCRYVGIDISEVALNEARRNLTDLLPGLKPNAIELIQADFFKGLQQVKRSHPLETLCITWLGSSVGILSKEDAVEFFKNVISTVGSTCQLLICMGMCNVLTQICVSATWPCKSVSSSAWICVIV